MKPLSRTLLAPVGVAALVLVTGALPSAGDASQTARRPVLTATVFRGFASDYVGHLHNVKPDGVRDGRFSVMLDTRGTTRVLTGVALLRVVGKGTAEAWDTNSVIAVFVNGRRVNPTGADLSVKLGKGKVRLDLYANDQGVFAPGQTFRIVTAFPDFVSSQTAVRLPGAPASVTSSFAGRGSDLVGRGNEQVPNGEPDGHFTATVATKGAWRILKDVAVRRVNTQGGLEAEGWDANPGTSFATLAVFVNGKRVPIGDTVYPVYVPIAPSSGPVRLDLFGNDPNPGVLLAGQSFRVTVYFTDAQISPETLTLVHIR